MRFYFSKFFLMLRFMFLPNSLKQKARINGVESVRFQFKEKGLPLIISFAGLGDQFNFVRTFAEMNVNVIFLRDPNHNWYLNELFDVGKSVDEIVAFIIQKKVEFKATKLFTIGTSAGGFAAILYGHLLQADNVLAFTPQTFMNRLNCIRYLDYRWLDRVVQIYSGPKIIRNYLDLSRVTKDSPVHVSIYFDTHHRLDSLHARRLKINGISYYPFKMGGHDLVKYLRNKGDLNSIILSNLI